ncbi:sigma-70 family RNA polymerase sigma factor [Pseudomonas sp. LFM046]|uniref:sigma-70 family RNA polymerase sigma factor n=1 Tax=Pseudomonas sp. LFM046 TaxID=1608357 RepID=UPI0005CFA196|nr:sigma-70 family RNA polymerase sigma factor [Pseudomonas sp. LFM046]
MNMIDDAELREMLQRLRRFALWLTRNASSADDLVQATLERALSRWGSKGDGNLRAWLFAILYRQFLDGQRRARRHARLLEFFSGGRSEEAPSTEELVVNQSTLEAFGQLPAEQRALLLLVSVEGLSYKEAAETLGIPIGTVMSRLSRARKALRELAEGEMPNPQLRVLK